MRHAVSFRSSAANLKVRRGDQAPAGPILDKKIAVIGFGSQGRAQALNLKDSGMTVCVGLRPDSPNRAGATAAGLTVMTVKEAAAWADVIVMLVPDEKQGTLFRSEIAPGLSRGKTLVFAHGFSILYKQVIPPDGVDVVLVAPKGVGPMVRAEYERGAGVPGLVAVHRDYSGHALETALAYAAGIGCARAGILETTFREETETDLFGEQAVICGGLTGLLRAGYETLVEAGYPPEMAYFECIHEVKLIADLVYARGISGMRKTISNTAEFGDYVSGPKVVNAGVKRRMKKVLKDIQSGRFARRWMNENQKDLKAFDSERAKQENHPLEAVGRKLRKLMPWLGD